MEGKKEFTEKTKLKCLLWSDRHCCLCGKSCGMDIEIAHIDPNGSNHISNAIPLCYYCHAVTGRYNEEHPRGNKYRIKELKTRRDQIYERFTKNLVPPIHFKIFAHTSIPRVDFTMTHHGDSLPIRFKVKARVFLGNSDLGLIDNPKKPYYSGRITWHLNPRHTFFGNFSVPKKCIDSNEELKIEVRVTIIDQYDRSHELLPVCYTYVRDEKPYWYLEPTSFSELKVFMKSSP